MNPAPGALLTVPKAAELLAMTTIALRRAIQRRTSPLPVVRLGRRVRLRWVELPAVPQRGRR